MWVVRRACTLVGCVGDCIVEWGGGRRYGATAQAWTDEILGCKLCVRVVFYDVCLK